MKRYQPALYSLHVFEAAARHKSFQQAALELGVTPGAVSRQILALEDTLGVTLFERRHRTVVLTAVGADYAENVRGALRKVRAATEKVWALDNSSPIVVSVAPSFALRWLMPRLGKFQQTYPDVGVQLTTIWAHRPVNFDRSHLDAAIVVSQARLPGLVNYRLQPIVVHPVCSPSLKLNSPRDLGRVKLLHSLPRPYDWARWLDFAGVRDIQGSASMTFDSQTLLIQAAVDGLGVAMGIQALVEQDLKTGLLKMPFDIIRPTRSSYYLVHTKEKSSNKRLKLFVDWLCDSTDTL